MAFHHIRLSVTGSQRPEVKTDLSEEQLERQFLEPYRRGLAITVNGRTVQPDQIERIRVSRSTEPAAQIADALRAEDQASSVLVIGGPSMSERVAARAPDVTDEVIVGPPGFLSHATQEARHYGDAHDAAGVPDGTAPDRTVAFLVEGRDSEAGQALKDFLRSVRLRIVEWEQAVAATGDPDAFIEDVVLAGFELAYGAIVLFTGDDEVRLRSDLLRDDDTLDEREMRLQPRPNVLYEAGLARARFPRRTVVVEIGPVKQMSDRAGRHVVRFDGSSGARRRLLNRLETAGFEIDDSGDGWLHAGDFTMIIDRMNKLRQNL